MTSLRGAHVLVTGASSGIGAALATSLHASGSRLTLLGRDEARLAKVCAGTGGEPLVVDLADAGQRAELAARFRSRPPDVVVHNAGIGLAGELGCQSAQDVDRVLELNLRVPVQLTREWLPAMVARGSGHLVFVASIAGALGVAEEAAYAASKGGLLTFAKSLRDELAPSGIRVTTVLPGVVATPFFTRRGSSYDRRFPRPLPAARLAAATVAAVEHDRTEVVRPRWLRLPIAVRATAPGLYAALADRFG
ncbi:MAG TPA: SDR family NAD(P)-dependent oxidoreductase [Segeticoccus sp.]|uniref:SDR family NAD(P)-dependent oxidoreductase n=1 Tax=Segeticoccus sp. TaxID=2706531 RepID=UPI002D7EA7B5|nr:SDR family NAD(P)-dependent oxidoreductase [Segeticoccus sp.]HET8600779.1 SDR family NAD(P)-dependent oxidoreductase [Segeticoccus sp.]